MKLKMVALSDNDRAASLAARLRTPASVAVVVVVVAVVSSSDMGDRSPLEVALGVSSPVMLVRAVPLNIRLVKERSPMAGIDDE